MSDEIVRDPLYLQINERLRALIRGNDFQAGSRFLTERQISERFRVSRATANKALSNLVSEGALIFRKGVGTFVAEDRLDFDLRALVSFTEKARAAGKTPSTRVLSFSLSPRSRIDDEAALRLRLSSDEGAYRMERLRLADETPVILEKRWIAARHCPGLEESMVSGSLFVMLSDRYHLDAAGADESIRAMAARGEDAKRLGMADGDAGLLVTAVAYLADGSPLWFERTLYRGDAYEFRNRIDSARSSHPAVGALL